MSDNTEQKSRPTPLIAALDNQGKRVFHLKRRKGLRELTLYENLVECAEVISENSVQAGLKVAVYTAQELLEDELKAKIFAHQVKYIKDATGVATKLLDLSKKLREERDAEPAQVVTVNDLNDEANAALERARLMLAESSND